MRLTCPNCGAQYEVPDEVIPAEGRDVQCSNCGDTWYQTHPDYPGSAFESEAEPEAPEAASDLAGVRAAVTGEPEPQEPRPSEAAAAERPAARKQELDRSVSEILREEAEREAQLRATEAGGLESQPDLGLESPADGEAARRSEQSRERMSQIRGESPGGPTQPTDTGSRRGLLPDIEEINSTLRSSGNGGQAARAGAAAAPADGARRRGGFSRGFLLALLLGAILALIYVNAPRIAQTWPQADPMLSAYVALVDQGRVWLDAKLGALVPE